MKDADRKQAEMIWEHLVTRLREFQNKARLETREASGPDHQSANSPNGGASRGEKPGATDDSDWNIRA